MDMSTPARTPTLPPPTEQPARYGGPRGQDCLLRLRNGDRRCLKARGNVEGSAGRQSDLWTEKARDWAEVMEGWSGWGVPVYRQVLERIAVDSSTSLLDIGCGAGRFSRIAADRGATVAGLDATAAFVEIARERVPDGDFRVGEMADLPMGRRRVRRRDRVQLVLHRGRHGRRAPRGAAGGTAGRGRRHDGFRTARALPVHGGVRVAATAHAARGGAADAEKPAPKQAAPTLEAQASRGGTDADGRRLSRLRRGVPRSGDDPARLHGRSPVRTGRSRVRRRSGPRRRSPRRFGRFERRPAGIASRKRSAISWRWRR